VHTTAVSDNAETQLRTNKTPQTNTKQKHKTQTQGPISLVVKRGEWVNRLGLGDAADFIGTRESIAVRVPDSTVTLVRVVLCCVVGVVCTRESIAVRVAQRTVTLVHVVLCCCVVFGDKQTH